jgi:hypothetical protein
MKLEGLDRRIDALESRLPPVKSDTQKFLEKCSDEELRRLKAITMKGEELTEGEKHFLADLEIRYGSIGEAEG